MIDMASGRGGQIQVCFTFNYLFSFVEHYSLHGSLFDLLDIISLICMSVVDHIVPMLEIKFFDGFTWNFE